MRTKIDRIEGLGDRIVKLRKDDGLTYKEIAEKVNEEFNLTGNNVVSQQNVFDFLKRYEYRKTITTFENEGDPNDLLGAEFRAQMQKLIEETDKIKELALSSPGNIRNILLAIDSQRKNLVALRKYAEHQIQKTETHIFKYNLEFLDLLRDIANDLCPVCREKVLKRIRKFENE